MKLFENLKNYGFGKLLSNFTCIKCNSKLLKDYFYNGGNNGFWCINKECERIGIPVRIAKEGSLPS